MRLSAVDALQELVRVTFLLEVNQILVIPVDTNIGVGSPSSLNFFGR
jgi:hypothetical protein